MTKAAVLDTSLQKTHEWLHEIGRELGFDNERAAYAALRATLHAVRDRLPTELVAHLGAELPMLVRGIYYDGWHPSAVKLKAAHDEDFLDAIRRKLRGHDELQHVGQAARTVLRVIDQRLQGRSITSSGRCLSRCAGSGKRRSRKKPSRDSRGVRPARAISRDHDRTGGSRRHLGIWKGGASNVRANSFPLFQRERP
jgi:uncharacterized protein (DUF2267 family)